MKQELKTRRGNTWQKMLRAVGSPKPLVSRSLRQWGVALRGRSVVFNWWVSNKTGGGSLASIDGARVQHASRVMIWGVWTGSLRGTDEIHVNSNNVPCEGDDPSCVLSMSTQWVRFRYPAGKEVSVPTALVLEAARLSMSRTSNETRSYHMTKKQRRALRRWRQAEKRELLRRKGSHERWSNLGKFVRMVMESNDVKEVDADLEVGPGRII